MLDQMMEVIDEVAWDLDILSEKVTRVHYMPNALKEELGKCAARLRDVYNEACRMEEEE